MIFTFVLLLQLVFHFNVEGKHYLVETKNEKSPEKNSPVGQDREGGAMFNVGKQKIKGLSCEEKGMVTMDNGECTDDQSDDLGFYGLGEAGRRH